MLTHFFLYIIFIPIINIFFLRILKLSQKIFFLFNIMLIILFIFIIIDNDLIIRTTYLFLFLGVFIIYLEFISLITRGFSINIVMELYKKKKMHKFEIIKFYSNGRGLKWLFKNRCEGIFKLKLAKLNDDNILFINSKPSIIIMNILNRISKIMNVKKL